MIQALATSRNRRVSLLFLAVTLLSLVAALTIGIDDNLPGIALAMLAALAAVLAFVHPWRSEPPFRTLLWGSLVAFLVSGFLHGALESLATVVASHSTLQLSLQFLAVAFFLAAVFLAPPAFLLGLIGSLLMLFRGRSNRPDAPSSAA